MADTKRALILAALIARLQVIHVGGELDGVAFMTNAGEKIFLGETPQLSETDPEIALAIVIGEETAAAPGQKLSTFIDLLVEVQMLAKADIDQPWLTVEAGLGDIKRAIELEDRQLGLPRVVRSFERGTVRTLPREPGSTQVGAGVTYTVGYLEPWGAP